MVALYLSVAGVAHSAHAYQPGKDGAATITTAGTVVNQYTTVTANAVTGDTTLTLANTASITPGDVLLIYQAQGATIDTTDTAAFGSVTSLGHAGTYEFVNVLTVPSATSVTIVSDCTSGLRYTYDANKAQAVRVPQYTTLTVSGAGSLVATPWNGSIGGIVAVFVQGAATIDGGGLSVAGQGFRGGVITDVTGVPGTSWSYYRVTPAQESTEGGAEKGESIAGYQATYDTSFNGRYGRGAPANGGGGGNAHNGGGGGGANGDSGVTWNGQGNPDLSNASWTAAWNLDPTLNAATTSSGGGRGGYTYGSSNQDALTVAPGNSAWGGNNRLEHGGLGGRPLTNDPSVASARLFFGGGGGAGDENNAAGSNGAAGGGLIYLIAGSVSGSATLTADGATATNTVSGNNDAPGGGGGGGGIVINAGTLTGVTLSASGGKGGDQLITSNESEGPGGGGGGGYIAYSGTPATAAVIGGVNGTTRSAAVTEFIPNGATQGGAGLTGVVPTINNLPVCTQTTSDLAITKTDGSASYTPGNAISYTIVASNAGPSDATGVTVTDTLPAAITGASWVCTAAGGATCPPSGVGNISAMVSLPVSGMATFVVTGTVNPAATGNLTNTATVTPPAGVFDPNPANNSATDTDTATPSADVSTTKSGPATVSAAGAITYTLMISNAGPSVADGATYADNVPAGITGVAATCGSSTGGAVCAAPAVAGNAVTGAVPSLPPGGSIVITITGTAPNNAGTLSNTANVNPPAGTSDPNPVNNTSATVTTTVTSSADVSLTKNGPAMVSAGGSITYTLTIGNAGPSSANGATYSDAVPAGITGVAASCGSPTGGAICAAPTVAGNTVSGSVPTLPSGGSVVITLTGTAPNNPTTLNNAATVTPPVGTTDPNPGNNTGSASTTVNASADIGLVKTVDNPMPNVGDTVTFTITATNHGPSDATGVQATDSLPSGLTLVSATPSTGTYTAATGLWNIGNISNGVSDTLTLVVTVTAPGLITNTASITAEGQPDPNGSNNSAGASLNATRSADIQILKTVDNAVPNVGGNVTFTVTATNAGPDSATGVQVTDLLPTGLALVSATPSTGTYTSVTGLWNIGTISNGANATLTIVATVTQAGAITNTATKTNENEHDPMLGNDQSGVTINGQQADIQVVKTVDNANPNVGTSVNFTITATNLGPSAATGVAITDLLPVGLTYQSSTPSQGTYTSGTGVWALGGLAASGAGATATLSIQAMVTHSGALTNTATKTAEDQSDPNTMNDTSSVSLNGNPVADVSVTKSGPASVTAGNSVVYSIVVTNNGPSDAQNVVVADPTPPGLTFLSNAGGCMTAFPCTLGTLTNGQAVTITATYAVPANYTAPNPIMNAASANSTTPDPNSNNNTGVASTTLGAAQADVSLQKTGPATVSAGGAITYTLLIQNAGPSSADGSTFADSVPAGITGVTVSCGSAVGGASCGATTVVGNAVAGTVATLPPGGSVLVTINGIAPNAASTLSNTASVTPPIGTTDPNPGNNASSVNTTVNAAADVALTKTGPATVTPGNTLAYTITVTNNGPSAAQNVTVSDVTPVGLTFVGNTGACTTTFPCSLGSLTNGQIAVITATYAVPANYVGANPIVNTASASSATADPDPNNNSGTANTNVGAGQADLAIVKSGPATVNAGAAISYSVLISNNGPSPANGATYADAVPAGITGVTANCGSTTGGATCAFPTVAGNMVTGTVPNLPSGGTVTVTIAGTAPNSATMLTNTATVTPPIGVTDPNAGNNQSTVATSVAGIDMNADLGITKTAPGTVTPGGNVVYTITVTNNGPDAAQNVQITDPTPGGLIFVGNAGACTTTFPCSVGTLTNGQVAVITSTFSVPSNYAGTAVTNIASVTSSTPDPTLNNNSSSANSNVVGAPGTSTPIPVDARWALLLLGLLVSAAAVRRQWLTRK